MLRARYAHALTATRPYQPSPVRCYSTDSTDSLREPELGDAGSHLPSDAPYPSPHSADFSFEDSILGDHDTEQECLPSSDGFKAFLSSQKKDLKASEDRPRRVPTMIPFETVNYLVESTRGELADEQTGLLPLPLPVRTFVPRHPRGNQPPPKLPFYKRRVQGVYTTEGKTPLQDLAPTVAQRSIPRLQHGLNRILTLPGPHWLQEPRTRFHNFPGWLKKVPGVEQFAFERVTGFVTSSRDNTLRDLAAREGCKFVGSTSSLSGMLSQIYLLLSNEKPVNLDTLSAPFQKAHRTFTPGQRMPVSVTLKYRDGVYATDSDSSLAGKTETILSQLGVVMERFLTMSPPEFTSTLMKDSPAPLSVEPSLPRDTYRYSKFRSFIMRAQLDCHHPVLPGTGVFDIKTRAAVPIRYDLENYKDNLDYKIRTVHGAYESFEKEYYDLIRSAFLKYSFQVRIGNMDGVFVAYHNTDEVFGFQYIPIEEMDMRLYGHPQGDRVFSHCINLLEAVFSEIITYFPKQTVHCTWETIEKGRLMHVWIEPKEWHTRDKPIIQLDVKVDHYLDRAPVSGRVAVGSVDGQWSVHYTIVKSTLKPAIIRKQRQAAFSRQLLIYKFGLHPDEKADHAQNIDLGHLNVSDRMVDESSFAFPGMNALKTEEITRPMKRGLRKKLILKDAVRRSQIIEDSEATGCGESPQKSDVPSTSAKPKFTYNDILRILDYRDASRSPRRRPGSPGSEVASSDEDTGVEPSRSERDEAMAAIGAAWPSSASVASSASDESHDNALPLEPDDAPSSHPEPGQDTDFDSPSDAPSQTTPSNTS